MSTTTPRPTLTRAEKAAITKCASGLDQKAIAAKALAARIANRQAKTLEAMQAAGFGSSI